MGYQNGFDESLTMSVIRTLIYYDIFEYPLLPEEVLNHTALKQNQLPICQSILDDLAEHQMICKIDGYFMLENNPEWITARMKGSKKAEKWMKKARRYSRLIYRFPYVRAISVSGSLSKGILGDDPDIDFFIITAKNRLWIARSMLVLFKKIFLFNSYKYFCINYFVDTSHLEIEEKNLFTATELATMLPMYGNGMKATFNQNNRWVNAYYPNFNIRGNNQSDETGKTWIKGLVEWFFNNPLGNRFDTYLWKLTAKHRERKFGNQYSPGDYQLVFKATKGISKHHPNNFQKKVEVEFEKRKTQFEQEHKMDLKNMVFQL